MAAHSKVGASAAKRWLTCPGSVRLADAAEADEFIGKDESSEFADDGTFAHRVLELAIGERVSVDEAVKTALAETPREVPPWLENAVGAAVEHLAPYTGDAYWLEQRVVFAEEHDGFGTCDFAAVVGDTLVIADFKSGVGVRVKAERNEQLLCYAIGVLHYLRNSPPLAKAFLPDLLKVRLVVLQPRVPDGITEWECSVDAVSRWAAQVMLPGLKATEDPAAELKRGDHCRFCPALAICPEWQKVVRAGLGPTARSEPDVSKLDPGYIEYVLETASILRKHIQAVEKVALKMALAGKGPDGYKVVHGKANRTWKAEATETLEMLYGDDAYLPRELKSPAQIEGLPGGDHVAKQFAYSPQGAPTLVPKTDQRPEYQHPNFQQLFQLQPKV